MSLKRYNAKRDAVEPAIVQALEAVGATVCVISAKGIPDLLVGFRGDNYLMEVKSPGGELTPAQVEFAEMWQGQRVVVRSVEDALQVLGVFHAR